MSPWIRLTALGGAAGTFVAVVSGSAGLGTTHRVLAALALPPLAAVAAAAWVNHRELLPSAVAALALFGLAAAITAPGLHLALSALAFAASLVLAAQSWRGVPRTLQHSVTWDFRGSVRDYLTLTKPRIMSLLLLTGLCGMIVGAGGLPPLRLVAVTMVGLGLACGGASALNHVLDADIDRLMGKRTRSRPVAAGRVPAPYALEFGLALMAFSFVLLAGVVNPLTAHLALAGGLFYVLVYTRFLKRSTPQNIVIGGAAGAVPPLVGWAAATGDLTLPALVLFTVVFLWTPPHFWALALLIKRDYEAAGVPMLPVVRGEDETARQIVLYTAALVAFTLAPALWGMFGLVYLVAAAALGAAFLALAWMLRRERTPARAGLLFHYSLLYLALLFVAMALDTVVA
ncbi:MAG TPA: heme o synthase [Gaiellaceae bacterium]|nr:heme o synthase [Gaiellaceae bacterium]